MSIVDKDKIAKLLSETFISEEAKHPGLAATEKVQKDSEKANKEGIKDVEKEMSDYDSATKDSEKENTEAVKKYENDEKAQEIHDEVETLNGVEMLEPDNAPGEAWEERQKKAITGKDSEMGNNRDYANVIPADQKGFTGPEFGEKLYDKIEKSKKKRKDAEIKYAALGDDIELNENVEKKEKMKKIVFKKEFNGVENALKLIPESFKVDNKQFQMTDGNENYEIRWEGDLNEGRAIILKASDKTLMNEDMQHMKHLMGYKSQDTLGTLKGEERINENSSFGDVWNKTKSLLSEQEDKEDEGTENLND